MGFYELAKNELNEIEEEIKKALLNEPKQIYGMLLPYIQRGGKRIRPLLIILCAKAFTEDARGIVKPATIVELFHNFTLIHDDICDNSEYRRGKPTLHVEYGLPIALNSGDALYTLIFIYISNLNLETKSIIEPFFSSSLRTAKYFTKLS